MSATNHDLAALVYFTGSKAHGIASDAHRLAGFDAVAYGVVQARRGWVEKGDVLNALSRDKLLAWLGRPARRATRRGRAA